MKYISDFIEIKNRGKRPIDLLWFTNSNGFETADNLLTIVVLP